MRQLHNVLLLTVILLAGGRGTSGPTLADTSEDESRPLEYWVAQATAEGGPEDLDATVSALSDAVLEDDPEVKVTAADALAVLGPRAGAALEPLLGQFGHEAPWVRVSCQAAVGSMGGLAVPKLIDTFENNTGGPRIRAAFVLASIGADAAPAIPTIQKAMADESPAMQVRLAGVLNQIDPQRFAAPSGAASVPTVPIDAPDSGTESSDETAGWPQFHGPSRDSICREKGLLEEWPQGGPPLLWTLRGLGRGYSSVAIVGGTVFTMGDRTVDGEESQFVVAYQLGTREEIWAARVGPPHSDGGPRCTPTVDGDRVYAIGTDGDLVCLDAKSGDVRWRKSFVEDFDGKFMAVWKFSESPLVDGERLICTPGGADATLVALNKQTGELIWKCAMPDLGDKGADGAGYSSAVVAEICGMRQYVQLIGRGVIAVEADTGRFLWGYNRIANNIANITSPAVRGDYVFTTTAYNTGSALLKISRDGNELRAEEVYFVAPRDFQNHHGGIVLVGDHVYGGHGPNRGDPTCVELATGKVAWKKRAPAKGSAAVLWADGHLIYRYDRGEVLLVEANPEELVIKGRFKPEAGDGPAWSHPVIHDGKLYLRHADFLACYDVRAN